MRYAIPRRIHKHTSWFDRHDRLHSSGNPRTKNPTGRPSILRISLRALGVLLCEPDPKTPSQSLTTPTPSLESGHGSYLPLEGLQRSIIDPTSRGSGAVDCSSRWYKPAPGTMRLLGTIRQPHPEKNAPHRTSFRRGSMQPTESRPSHTQQVATRRFARAKPKEKGFALHRVDRSHNVEGRARFTRSAMRRSIASHGVPGDRLTTAAEPSPTDPLHYKRSRFR